MKKIFTLFSVLFVAGAMNAQSFWTNLNSPSNCTYYSVAHDGSKMFACNGNVGGIGQFYYKQGAAPFNSVAVTINTITSLNNINCLANGNVLITGNQGTVPVVYRSVDNGSNWTQSTASLTGFNQNIIQDAAGNVYLYNYALGSTISKSTDNGGTFAAIGGTFAVKWMAATGNTLFACGTNSGWNIWKSTDGAATWSLMPNNATQGNQNSVYATPNGNVYFGDYRSTDGGTTWVLRTAPPTGSGIYMVDALNNIYVKDEPTNLYKSSDAGTTYTNVVNGLNWSPTCSAVRKIATNDGKLYFSTANISTVNSFFIHQTGTISAVAEQEMNSTDLHLSPVPANDQLSISIEKGNISSVSVSDISGKVNYTQSSINKNSMEISLANFAAGVYFVKITAPDGAVMNKKIVVQH